MVEMTEEQYRRLTQRQGGWFWALFGVVLLGLMAVLTLDHFGLIPLALVDKIVGTPQVQFSSTTQPALQQQPQAQPAIDTGPHLTPFYRPADVAQPAAMPAAPTAVPVPTATPPANLAPSGPSLNPGFTCGVEPGMPPNADCQETNPNNDAQLSSAPKRGPLHVGERSSEKAGPQEGGE